MCGRYLLTHSDEEIEASLKVPAPSYVPPRYNVAPRQPVLIVRRSEQGKRELAAVEWGLVPEWKKEIGEKPLINARVETVEAKPSFRSSVKRKRCLVPFSGWYEWKTQNGLKTPQFIEPVDSSLGAFAGLWSTWHGPDGEHWLETMAIITSEAIGPLRHVHHRKPLVVKPADYTAWLEPHDPLPRNFLNKFEWEGEERFHSRPVSRKVNSVRFEGEECLLPPEENPQGLLF